MVLKEKIIDKSETNLMAVASTIQRSVVSINKVGGQWLDQLHFGGQIHSLSVRHQIILAISSGNTDLSELDDRNYYLVARCKRPVFQGFLSFFFVIFSLYVYLK